jgi:hypothetical protein
VAKVQFFSQKMIDDWAGENKVQFDGKTLKVLVGNKGAYDLEPATRFLEPIEGEDKHQLVRKVLTQKHLDGLSADVYLDSALVGEVAYKVEPGFVVAQKNQIASPSEKREEPRKKEEETLADFMLKALSEQK